MINILDKKRGLSILKSFEIKKAYTEGIYADTPANRKLGRVGMSYKQYAEQVSKQQGQGNQNQKTPASNQEQKQENKKQEKFDLDKVVYDKYFELIKDSLYSGEDGKKEISDEAVRNIMEGADSPEVSFNEDTGKFEVSLNTRSLNRVANQEDEDFGYGGSDDIAFELEEYLNDNYAEQYKKELQKEQEKVSEGGTENQDLIKETESLDSIFKRMIGKNEELIKEIGGGHSNPINLYFRFQSDGSLDNDKELKKKLAKRGITHAMKLSSSLEFKDGSEYKDYILFDKKGNAFIVKSGGSTFLKPITSEQAHDFMLLNKEYLEKHPEKIDRAVQVVEKLADTNSTFMSLKNDYLLMKDKKEKNFVGRTNNLFDSLVKENKLKQVKDIPSVSSYLGKYDQDYYVLPLKDEGQYLILGKPHIKEDFNYKKYELKMYPIDINSNHEKHSVSDKFVPIDYKLDPSEYNEYNTPEYLEDTYNTLNYIVNNKDNLTIHKEPLKGGYKEYSLVSDSLNTKKQNPFEL